LSGDGLRDEGYTPQNTVEINSPIVRGCTRPTRNGILAKRRD